METLTIGERMLLHLDRYSMVSPDKIYDIPWDLTQDGIATSLRISRAHASLELKKQKEAGRVEERQSQVRGTRGCKRKTFYLTDLGRSKVSSIKEYVESKGIVIDSLLDLRRCDPRVLWESLDPDAQIVMGQACVFRLPIPRSDLPETRTSVIPIDSVSGMICISEKVRTDYLGIVDPVKVREWNGWAADYWMDHGSESQEQLYHLVESGRRTEASKLILRRRDEFLDNANEDLDEILSKLSDVPDRYAKDVYTLRADVAVEASNADNLDAVSVLLRPYDPEGAELYRADALIARGNPEGALDIVASMPRTARSELRTAKALFDLERFDDAETVLERAYSAMMAANDLTGMDQIMTRKAELEYRRGNRDDAAKLLAKSRVHASQKEKARIDRIMKDLTAGKEPRFR